MSRTWTPRDSGTVFDTGAMGPAKPVLDKLVKASRETNKANQLQMVQGAMAEFKTLIASETNPTNKKMFDEAYTLAVTQQQQQGVKDSTFTFDPLHNTAKEIKDAIKEIFNYNYTGNGSWEGGNAADTSINKLVRTYFLSRIIKSDTDDTNYKYSEGATKTKKLIDTFPSKFLSDCNISAVQPYQKGRQALSHQLLRCATTAYNKGFSPSVSTAALREDRYETEKIFKRDNQLINTYIIEDYYFEMKQLFPMLGETATEIEIRDMRSAFAKYFEYYDTGKNPGNSNEKKTWLASTEAVLNKQREVIAATVEDTKRSLTEDVVKLIDLREKAYVAYRAALGKTSTTSPPPAGPPTPPPSPPPAATAVDDDGELAKQLAEKYIAEKAVVSSVDGSPLRTAANAWKAAQDDVYAKAQEIAGSTADELTKITLRTALVGLRNTARDEKTFYSAVKNRAEAAIEVDLQGSSSLLGGTAGNWGAIASNMEAKIKQIKAATEKTPLRTDRDKFELDMLRAKYTYYNGAAAAAEDTINKIPSSSRTSEQTAFLAAAIALKNETKNVATDANPNYVSFMPFVEAYKKARDSVGTIAVRTAPVRSPTIAVRPDITAIEINDVFVKDDDVIRIMFTNGEDVYTLSKTDDGIQSVDIKKTQMLKSLNKNKWNKSIDPNVAAELKFTLTISGPSTNVNIGEEFTIVRHVKPARSEKFISAAPITNIYDNTLLNNNGPTKFTTLRAGKGEVSAEIKALNIKSTPITINVGPSVSGNSSSSSTVNSIKFPQVTYSVIVGTSIRLNPIIVGGGGIIYTSDNRDIATVSGTGDVTGIKAGTAKITVTLSTGETNLVTVFVDPKQNTVDISTATAAQIAEGFDVHQFYVKDKKAYIYIKSISDDMVDIEQYAPTEGMKRIQSTAIDLADFIKKNTYTATTRAASVLPSSVSWTGGARKNRRTRNRKTNLRRKTGKRSKPSRPSQSSSQQLF